MKNDEMMDLIRVVGRLYDEAGAHAEQLLRAVDDNDIDEIDQIMRQIGYDV